MKIFSEVIGNIHGDKNLAEKIEKHRSNTSTSINGQPRKADS